MLSAIQDISAYLKYMVVTCMYGLSLPNNPIPLTSDTAYRFNNKSVKIVLNIVGVSVTKCIKIHNGYPVAVLLNYSLGTQKIMKSLFTSRRY